MIYEPGKKFVNLTHQDEEQARRGLHSKGWTLLVVSLTYDDNISHISAMPDMLTLFMELLHLFQAIC